MTIPKLSICIPTLNRIKLLKELLDSLIPQAKNLAVEICISDNCSSDGTSKYLSEISKLHDFIRVNTHKEKVTIDENMLFAIRMGNGKFIYPLGDDDFIREYHLEKILNELDENLDMLVVNAINGSDQLEPEGMLLPLSLVGKRFVDPITAFEHLWDRLPFGSFIAASHCFQSELKTRFHGTSHAYTGVVWDNLATRYSKNINASILCGTNKSTILRNGAKTWSSTRVLIMLYEIPLWINKIGENPVYKHIAPLVCKKYISVQSRWTMIMRYRASGQLNASIIDVASQFFNRVSLIKYQISIFVPVSKSEKIVRIIDFLRTSKKMFNL